MAERTSSHRVGKDEFLSSPALKLARRVENLQSDSVYVIILNKRKADEWEWSILFGTQPEKAK